MTFHTMSLEAVKGVVVNIVYFYLTLSLGIEHHVEQEISFNNVFSA